MEPISVDTAADFLGQITVVKVQNGRSFSAKLVAIAMEPGGVKCWFQRRDGVEWDVALMDIRDMKPVRQKSDQKL